MEIGKVGEEDGEEGGEWDVDAVDPARIQCHQCGVFGHFARNCQTMKGKGKGKNFEKGKGKGLEKGKGKGTYKGKGSYPQIPPMWAAPTWNNPAKGKSKGKGYQGTCYACGAIGHKAAECQRVSWVEERGEEENEEVHQIDTTWSIASVEVQEGRPMKLTRKMEPMEIHLSNKFGALEESEMIRGIEVAEEEEAEMIGGVGVNDGEVKKQIEIVIDSGAAKSVWPKMKKGVEIRKLDKKPKLVAANGSNIEVVGEAVLRFNKDDKSCAMKFLDADVKKPLAAVSAIVDEGNMVTLTANGGFIRNLATGEEIPIKRQGGTFVIRLEAEDKKKRNDKMEINEAMEEDEKEVVFRRRVL